MVALFAFGQSWCALERGRERICARVREAQRKRREVGVFLDVEALSFGLAESDLFLALSNGH